jgi:transcriptional regulator with XRE-family HTH domain
MSKNRTVIAKNIRKYRKKEGLSQDKLAKKTGLSFHTIVKIESGDTENPTIETVKKIADAFGVSLDKLVKNNYD